MIGLSIMLINPNIDTFITKFELTEDNKSSYISILSLVNPLGGLVGVFIAKSLVRIGMLTILFKDGERPVEDHHNRGYHYYCSYSTSKKTNLINAYLDIL
jgi:hypothetical protein